MRILSFLSVLASVGPVYCQTSSVHSAQEFVVDPTKPPVYIRYAEYQVSTTSENNRTVPLLNDHRTGRRGTLAGESERGLRLFNNVRTAIWITTASGYVHDPSIPPSDPMGPIFACFTVECTPLGRSILDSTIIGRSVKEPDLSVPVPGMRKKPKSLYRRLGRGCGGGIVGTFRLPSGKSVLLEVPRKYLWPRCRISLDFNYEWESMDATSMHPIFPKKISHEVHWP